MEELAVEFSGSQGAHPWGPVVVNRPARAGGRLVKVVAFNARGAASLDKIALLLRRPPLSDPDVILLSEMDWRLRRSHRRETAAELAADLEMSLAYIGEFGLPRLGGEP